MNTKITTTPTKTTIWTEYAPSDRNIILITENSVITGVNFWQGIDEDLFSDYNRADEHLTRFVMPRFFREFDTECISHANFDMMIDFIDDAIWDYVDRDNKTIAIPSIGYWLYGCKFYPMERSANGLIQRCTFNDGEMIHLDEITKWPFDEISDYDFNRMTHTDNDVLTPYAFERIANLMHNKEESSADDVTITIPKEQLDIIREALVEHLATMRRLIKFPSESQEFQMFDMHQLESLMKYDVKVTLTAKQANDFCGENGIDLPIYN